MKGLQGIALTSSPFDVVPNSTIFHTDKIVEESNATGHVSIGGVFAPKV